MLSAIKTFISDESGATAIEYGLIAALVSVASIAGLSEMGDSLATVFVRVTTVLNGAVTP